MREEEEKKGVILVLRSFARPQADGKLKNRENIVAIWASIKSVKYDSSPWIFNILHWQFFELLQLSFLKKSQKSLRLKQIQDTYFMDKTLKFRTLCVRWGASRNRRARSSVVCRDQRALCTLFRRLLARKVSKCRRFEQVNKQLVTVKTFLSAMSLRRTSKDLNSCPSSSFLLHSIPSK